MPLISNNAYRILGLYAGATRREVLAAANAARTRAKLGRGGPSLDPLSALAPVVRTESSIRDAVSRLENARTRQLERLFWFANHSSSDALAIRLLEGGAVDRAKGIWKSDGTAIAMANLARLELAIGEHIDDPTVAAASLGASIEAWRSSTSRSEFWDSLQTLERETGFEPRATVEEVLSLNNILWPRVADVLASRIGMALANGNADHAEAFCSVLRMAKLPAAVADVVEKQAFGDLAESVSERMAALNDELSNAEGDAFAVEWACRSARETYRQSVLPNLESLARLAGVDASIYQEKLFETQQCLRRLSIAAFNEADDFELSDAILNDALALPESPRMVERLRQDQIDILSSQASFDVHALMDELNDSLSEASGTRQALQACVAALERATTCIDTLLVRLESCAGRDSEQCVEAREGMAIALRSISVRFHNDADDTTKALEVLSTAVAIADGTSVETRLNNDLRSLRATLIASAATELSRDLPWHVDFRPEPFRADTYPPSRSIHVDRPSVPSSFLSKPFEFTPKVIAVLVALGLAAVVLITLTANLAPTSTRRAPAASRTSNGKAINTSGASSSNPVASNGTPKSSGGTAATDSTPPASGRAELGRQIEKDQMRVRALEWQLKEIDSELSKLEATLNGLRAEIKSIEQRIRSGGYVNEADYDEKLSRHNRTVQRFNSLVDDSKSKRQTYQSLLSDLNSNIDRYNRMSE